MTENGKQIGRYRILSSLGAGGMGEVFLADDTELERSVALKILPEDLANDKERMRRFVQEAKSASALNHPNIITIHEIGKTDNTHFIVTEYIEGETLRERLKSEPMNLKSALEVAIQIASALDAAHRAGIVHRDIKPENIMIRPDGFVKIVDFGIAKLIERRNESIGAEAATAIKAGTKDGMIIGTASYMSPEQARGKDIDARSDVFSFGVVLYEMLAGKQPFEGESAIDTISSIIHKEPVPLSQLTPDIPRELQHIVEKSLRKDREERYQTAKDLLIDLKDVRQDLEIQNKLERTAAPNREEPKTQILSATTTDVAHTTSSAEYVVNEIKSHKGGFAIGLIVLLLASIGLGYWYFKGSSAKQIDSIAVLPFVNEGGNADTEYLSDGITETLIGSLSQIPNLNVKARTSVFRYKDKEIDPKQIGQELSVQAILTGRVIQRGQDLTLYVELIDAATENVLWKDNYSRPVANLVSLQSDIVKDVSSKLKTKLSGVDEQQVTKRYTENTEAYQLYLKGLYHWNKRTANDVKQAITLFQQAIDKDPAYAKAYGGLAMSYVVLRSTSVMTREEFEEAKLKANSAARKALDLDSTLAEAYAVLGWNKFAEWDFAGAENDFKRAIELNPNFATARQWYSHLLSSLGRHDEALTEVKKAYELDPFSPAVNANVGLRYLMAGRYDEAITQFKRLIETEPTYANSYGVLGRIYAERGMYEEALDLSCKEAVLLKIHTTESCEKEKAAFREAIKKDGATGFWRKSLERNLKDYEKGIRSAVFIAASYARLGEKELAFEWLEKAFATRDPGLSYLKNERAFDNVKSDPRFQDLLRRIGLPQ